MVLESFQGAYLKCTYFILKWHTKWQILVAFIFCISNHIMVSDNQNKYKNAKHVGEKTQVLIVNHLQNNKWNPNLLVKNHEIGTSIH